MKLKEPYDIVKIKPKVSNLTKDLKGLEDETLKNLRNSKAQNTLRAYASDFRHFKNFCIDNNVKYLPSDPRIISLYLTKLAKTSKFSTLKRRIASITVIHKLKGHYLDTKHPIIMLLWLLKQLKWTSFFNFKLLTLKITYYIISDN